MPRSILAALLASLAPLSASASEIVTDIIRPDGKPVRVRRFEPKGPGPFPAVILLHGLDGASGAHYAAIGKALAAQGYLVVLPHYLDATGTKDGGLPELCGRFEKAIKSGAALPADLRQTYRSWQAAGRAAVAHARKHPKVDGRRVGLVGFSGGGFLACSLAAEPGVRAKCVVELFGGMPREDAAAMKHFPPALIIHGDADTVVPVAEAHALRDALAARKMTCEHKVYEGVGHCFKGGDKAWEAGVDAQMLAAVFLDTHLSPGPRPDVLVRGR